ncbi:MULTISPECIES: VOC family protein [Streptomyces]|uniref:VOC family protein n=1 Tax=Streptomyces TaxID=1883 RepID=UPI0036528D70
MERRLALCRPRASHFLDQIAEMCTIKAAEGRMGLDGVRSDIAMMRTPDGHSKLVLTKYHTPAVCDTEPRNPPPNTLGLHRVMFAVDDIDDTIARLRARGAELLGEVAQYENIFRLCNLRGPAGIIVALAEQIG